MSAVRQPANTGGDVTGACHDGGVDAVRVVQVSDSHLSAAAPIPAGWDGLRGWFEAQPPDLVVHSGDIVRVDPDDERDRQFAHRLISALAPDVVVIPGNHDVGFFDERTHLPRRLDAFRTTWGDDTFVRDVGRWRLVGANVYRLGDDDHDRWLRDALATPRPLALFVHQPVGGDAADGWEMPAGRAASLRRLLTDAGVRVVACGHRHVALVADGPWRTVWAPSTIYVGDGVTTLPGATVERTTGVIEHVLRDDGTHAARVVAWSTFS